VERRNLYRALPTTKRLDHGDDFERSQITGEAETGGGVAKERSVARADVEAYGHRCSPAIPLRNPAHAPIFSAQVMQHWRPSIPLVSSSKVPLTMTMAPGLFPASSWTYRNASARPTKRPPRRPL
jgi:hypothetical protein